MENDSLVTSYNFIVDYVYDLSISSNTILGY